MYPALDISKDSNVVAILTFLLLTIGAIVSPFLSSRRTTKKLGTPNGATKKSYGDTSQYSDYNLYDLCLESLVNSKDAKEAAANAVLTAKVADTKVSKLLGHFGIE